MQLLGLLFFGHVILLLGRTVDCDDRQRVYQVKSVRNITEPSRTLGRDSYDIDEKNLVDFFPMEKLSEADRVIVCKEAVKKANEKTGNVSFKVVEGSEMSVTKAYLVEKSDAKWLSQPKLILAYKCSVEPDMYVQIHDRHQRGVFASLTTVIFREGDVKSTIRCDAEAMVYAEKIVDEISPVPWSRVEEAKNRLVENVYDTDNFKEEMRMAMCRKALDVEGLVNRNVKFLKFINTTDVRRLYYVITDARHSSGRDVVLAFGCPTIPAVYLEVREVAENESHLVSVMVKRSQLPSKFRDIGYNYQPKTVLSISETSTPVQTQRLPFHHIFETLFHQSTVGEIDPNRFTERQRSRMCEQAFHAIHQEEGKHLEYLDSASPGKCGFYRVTFELGKTKEVLAFRCATSPPVFLSLGEQGTPQNVWIYIEESEPRDIFPKLNIVGFKMKIVTNIIDVPMSTLPRLLLTEELQQSAIDPDALSRAKRGQLCEKAKEAVSVVKIKYFSEIAIEMSRYYKLLETESAETQPAEYHILQAYKCPTAPEILLHIAERADDGNVLWIIMKESETLHSMHFTGYQVKSFKEIAPVEPEDIRREKSTVPLLKCAIRIEKLDEDKRTQMCRTAYKIAAQANMEFSKKTKTGRKRYYAVSSESEGKRSKEFVEAFKCPTEPALYLHVKDDQEKFTVWIMVEETTRTLVVDELRYDVMATASDITPVKPSELKKESRDNMQKSAIDTDNSLTPGERLQMCHTATGHILGINIFNFVVGQNIGDKKYYAINVDSKRAQTSRSTALLPLVVEAFQCPTKPPVFLHVDEDPDGFVVWVMYKKPPPLIIDDLNFEVKIVKKITELSLTALQNEPPEGVERMVVDTDLLQERERRSLCRNALSMLPEMNGEFLRNTIAGKKKFYAMDEYSGLTESPYVRVVVQAFSCPSRPLVYVHINNREFSDEYEAWVILQEPLPNVDSLSYRFKVVDRINPVSSTELVSNRPEGREDFVDTNDFPPQYRSQMCEKAVEKISKYYVKMLPNRVPSDSHYYYYHSVESRRPNQETALAFKCATAPEILIEVKKLGEKYLVWVLIKDVDMKDEGEEICYLVQFVESIAPVTLSESRATAVSNVEVDTNLIRPRTRSRMCHEASKESALSDLRIKFPDENSTENKYFIRFYTVELASGERYDVEALSCPCEPPIYLQMQCWKPKCHIVAVIVEKRLSSSQPAEGAEGPSEPRDATKSRESRGSPANESTRSRNSSDSEEEFIEYRIMRNAGRNSSRARKSSAGSRKLKEVSVDSRGSGEAEESLSDLERLGLSEPAASRSPQTRDTRLPKPSKDEIPRQRRRNASSSSLETYDDIPLPTNVRHIDSLELATDEQIRMMPSSRREKSMVNTDTAYTKEQREKMCRAAIHFLQPMDNVELLSGGETGPSLFYIVHVRPLINRNGKQKILRAFECPTEPTLYLEVRGHAEGAGATMRVLVKNKSFVTFDLKLAESIGKVASSEQKDERLVHAKRLHMCRTVFKIMKKIMKGPIEFFNKGGAVGDDQSYILNLGSKDAEHVTAFKCPCKPDIYLQVQRQNRYDKVSIITLASVVLSPSPEEYPTSRDRAASASYKIDAKKLSFTKRLVSDITEDEPPDNDDEERTTEKFVPDERDSICSEAMKSFPDEKFILVGGFPGKSRKYIVNERSQNRDTVTAFRCATDPALYVHVEGNEVFGYSRATVIMVTKKKSPPISVSSSRPTTVESGVIVDDIRYTLVPVAQIKILKNRSRAYSAEQIPPPSLVKYTAKERQEICENSLEVLGPGKDFVALQGYAKDNYVDYLFAVWYESELDEEEIVSAFVCGSEPAIYIEMGWDKSTNMAVANVLMKRDTIPVVS